MVRLWDPHLVSAVKLSHPARELTLGHFISALTLLPGAQSPWQQVSETPSPLILASNWPWPCLYATGIDETAASLVAITGNLEGRKDHISLKTCPNPPCVVIVVNVLWVGKNVYCICLTPRTHIFILHCLYSVWILCWLDPWCLHEKYSECKQTLFLDLNYSYNCFLCTV